MDLAAAFAELREGMRAYVRRRGAEPALADDLVQDVFLKASVALRGAHAPRHLPAWLYAALRSALADHYRAARPQPLALDEVEAELGAGLSAAALQEQPALAHQQLAQCLRPLLGQLPAIYGAALIATDLEGLRLAEAAARQGLSLAAMKSRVSRARALLRARLLACCEPQFSQGLVDDYRRKQAKAAGCAGAGCASGGKTGA
ncbi:RNA polymerase sigma-70 factor (ECF subfamily) [Paucibacter oligotrophus]|uniref:RNA polymerase sigma-70 factor (ECF subfamily) n=1 Tax=Roseateles oligotrophus TaxID=1769250 RepID=A0A840L9J2_9BURK|nr:sigma-70 family RNA polymerase sigma factor [Roseateles oligotrophus]MBB4844840.1 RNA polymerase sigma-70 factor (ECF subfamily) [Roseateles oligotrophus]